QKTHRRRFLLCRQRLHNRADEHFNQPSSHSIQCDSSQNSHVAVSEEFREHGQPDKSRSRKDMCCHHCFLIADPFHVPRRCQIYRDLEQEIKGHKETNLLQGNRVLPLESHKQQRRKIIYNRLGNIPDIAGIQCLFILSLHSIFLYLLSKLLLIISSILSKSKT